MADVNQSCDSTMTRLLAATDSGPLAAMVWASWRASASASPGLVSRLIRPYWYARAAGNMSPVRANSSAMR
jgi:hypothetical protein